MGFSVRSYCYNEFVEPTEQSLDRLRLRNLALNPDGRRVAFTAGIPTGEVWMLENFLPAGASRRVR